MRNVDHTVIYDEVPFIIINYILLNVQRTSRRRRIKKNKTKQNTKVTSYLSKCQLHYAAADCCWRISYLFDPPPSFAYRWITQYFSRSLYSIQVLYAQILHYQTRHRLLVCVPPYFLCFVRSVNFVRLESFSSRHRLYPREYLLWLFPGYFLYFFPFAYDNNFSDYIPANEIIECPTIIVYCISVGLRSDWVLKGLVDLDL